MERYTLPMRRALAQEVAALPLDELYQLLRYFHTRGGPGLRLVRLEYLKRTGRFARLKWGNVVVRFRLVRLPRLMLAITETTTSPLTPATR